MKTENVQTLYEVIKSFYPEIKKYKKKLKDLFDIYPSEDADIVIGSPKVLHGYKGNEDIYADFMGLVVYLEGLAENTILINPRNVLKILKEDGKKELLYQFLGHFIARYTEFLLHPYQVGVVKPYVNPDITDVDVKQLLYSLHPATNADDEARWFISSAVLTKFCHERFPKRTMKGLIEAEKFSEKVIKGWKRELEKEERDEVKSEKKIRILKSQIKSEEEEILGEREVKNLVLHEELFDSFILSIKKRKELII